MITGNEILHEENIYSNYLCVFVSDLMVNIDSGRNYVWFKRSLIYIKLAMDVTLQHAEALSVKCKEARVALYAKMELCTKRKSDTSATLWSDLKRSSGKTIFWYFICKFTQALAVELWKRVALIRRFWNLNKGSEGEIVNILILTDHSSLVNGSVAAKWKEDFWLYHSWIMKVKEDKTCQH